jgi:hypothetical protein
MIYPKSFLDGYFAPPSTDDGDESGDDLPF